MELTHIKHVQSKASESATDISSISVIQDTLTQSIHDFLKMLDLRKQAHYDCNGDLQELVNVYFRATHTDIWYPNDSGSTASDYLGDEISQEAFYIVNCPKLHAISYNELSALVTESPRETGKKVCSVPAFEIICLALLAKFMRTRIWRTVPLRYHF